ncbi:MAG: ABC transporter ATP-binding protein [Bacteroidetes bacterium]|nr:MAG: ABC transporter ATP-binding protein [Bacteroidota bacterium]REJ99791.1 MAG: ABC transporter ATP-binding protein [Bacteroidota bacterium]REK34164.1 MAG: ABC transporter ATP-binding protein [Bacteroidota bacterium]REK50494.1 MAG: ABC transporter ATP-binding protein [Bacteroidota bacterium]
MIIAKDISKSYEALSVLKDVSLEIKKGEIVSIVGPSGAGKSTLLHILGTLDRPDNGKVMIDGTEITSMNSKSLSAFRNKKIGFVFQSHHLLPEFSAIENIMLPAMIAGQKPATIREKARELMKILGIDKRESNRPSELSGGEQQRVAVARALINDPAVVFADEPSGNLDSANAKSLHNLFFSLRDSLNQTFVIVTHSEELANMSDRKLHIEDGVLS